MESHHTPVLLARIVAALNVQADGCYVDATFGCGGHAREILDHLGSGGRLIVLDADPSAITGVPPDKRVVSACGNFRDLGIIVPTLAAGRSINGIFMDLGISSAQLSDPTLGLSFQTDGPLLMRLDRNVQAMNAATIVNTWSMSDLGNILRNFGEERQWRKIAEAIVFRRKRQRFSTTADLAALISQVVGGRYSRRHPATKTFQALRMAVNDELGNLAAGLAAACDLLAPGGRLAVITFHSLEDRAVKQYFRSRVKNQGDIVLVNKKTISPERAEILANPRARSAKLRVVARLG